MRNYRVTIGERSHNVTLIERKSTSVTFAVQGERYTVAIEGARVERLAEADPAPLPPSNEKPATPSFDGTIRAPMPGFVASIKVKEGDTVQAGMTLLTIEAMKMENPLTAPKTGVVEKIQVTQGSEVSAGTPLITIK